MGQKAFYFDMTVCVGCHACQIACRDRCGLFQPEEIYRKVDVYEGGKFPHPWFYVLSMGCNHCEKPVCAEECPRQALTKDALTGLVSLDEEKCIGCGMCSRACPYHAPILRTVKGRKKAGKCDGCLDLVQKGENPVCVDACSMRALEFGDLSILKERHPEAVSDLKCLPSSETTHPAFLVRPLPEALTEEAAQVT